MGWDSGYYTELVLPDKYA